MKSLFIVMFLMVGLSSSCSFSPKNLDKFMVDISEFTINDTILMDGDFVQILGSSGNLTKQHNIDFYSLVVVKSERTGDTVNVLVPIFFMADLNNPRIRFMSNSSVVGKILNSVLNKEELDGKNLDDFTSKSFNKVLYDSEYIQVDVREYPAITGNLGDYTITGDMSLLGS